MGMNASQTTEDKYRFDLFLSYRSETVTSHWINEVLLPLLSRHYMGEAGKQLRVHNYAVTMSQGGEWPLELKRNLAHSRCLLSLWCAGYFRSPWCVLEHTIMRRREDLAGYRNPAQTNGLILPIVVSDGTSFPSQVASIQALDIKKLVYTSASAFTGAAKYLELEDVIRDWMPNAIRAINTAPDWKSDWLTAEPLFEFDAPHFDTWNPGI